VVKSMWWLGLWQAARSSSHPKPLQCCHFRVYSEAFVGLYTAIVGCVVSHSRGVRLPL